MPPHTGSQPYERATTARLTADLPWNESPSTRSRCEITAAAPFVPTHQQEQRIGPARHPPGSPAPGEHSDRSLLPVQKSGA